MIRSRSVLVFGLLSGLGGALARAADWPSYPGPNGNYTQPPCAVPLLDDLSGAKLRWESQEKDLPAAKLRSSGNPYSRPSGGMSRLSPTAPFSSPFFGPAGGLLSPRRTGGGRGECRRIG
ncbi:MAG TPA: hypothetical protein VH575_27720 [Gemmataceae bacterium]